MRYTLLILVLFLSSDLLSQSINDNQIRMHNTNYNNATNLKHGFLRKLNNDSTYYLNGKGQWEIPPDKGEQMYSDTNDYDATRHWVDSNYLSLEGGTLRGALRFTGANDDLYGDLSIDTANAVRLTGNTTTWDDLFFPFQTGTNAGTGYPVHVSDSGYYTFVVDTTGISKCIMYFIVQLPHSWKEESKIYPHIHFKYESGIGPPHFIMKYKWYALGGTTDISGGWSWYRMDNITGTTNNSHQLCYGDGGIDGTGKGISSILICHIYLKSIPTNVKAYMMDIHYEIDSFGSNSETQKD